MFSLNITALASVFGVLLDKSNKIKSTASKNIALMGLLLKVPVLIALMYFLIRVQQLPVIQIFAGSILAMFVSGWIFFEDHLKDLAK